MEKKKIDYLDNILNRFFYLKEKFTNTLDFFKGKNVNFYKEYSHLEKCASLYLSYKEILNNINEIKIMMNSDDYDIRILAAEEMIILKEKKKKYENIINNEYFIDKDSNINNIYLEIRSATGGDESAIFTEDLFKMYTNYIDGLDYIYSVISFSSGNSGGYKDVVIRISGNGVFNRFKYESGIHRVQRIPKTDSHDRVHTSTCTIAILPEIKFVDKVKIDNCDIRIDTFRSSGAGGQHVNVTDSAVRITHLPTGIVTECQNERSQHKNKHIALTLLASKLVDRERFIQKNKLDSERKKVIGTGSRSEKIRTYNYIENRVTDHRFNLTIYRLSDIINGRLDLLLDKIYVKKI